MKGSEQGGCCGIVLHAALVQAPEHPVPEEHRQAASQQNMGYHCIQPLGGLHTRCQPTLASAECRGGRSAFVLCFATPQEL